VATRILVIDDEPLICQLLEYQLGGAGYAVSSYQNGAQALLRFTQEQPDLVLLDVMMPGTSGWDICRQIRAASPVPVIMLTAKQADDDVVMGLNCGADDYIGKPFSEQQLLARIAAVLRRAAPTDRRATTADRRVMQPVLATKAQPAPQATAPVRRASVPSAPVAAPTRLGPKLAAARQARNLSLHDAERICHVRWEFLQAIEQEQFRYLPREELRSALRIYCEFLDVDLKPYLQRRPPPRRRRPKNYLLAHLAVSAVLVLMIILGAAALLF
jgi:DNA-binding response OmpR family regulator